MMPGIIDRYVLRSFLWLFVICFVSLAGLYVVIHAFTNLDAFLIYAEKQGPVLPVMAQYYGYRLVFLFDRLQAVVVLIAAMFTVTALQQHNEMVALVAAGISHARVVLPLILAAAVFSGVAAANRELVIPRFKDQLERSPSDLLEDATQAVRPRYDRRTDILLRGARVIINRRTLTNPDFLLPPGLDRYGRHLVAKEAVYQPANKDHPPGYLLRGVTQPEDVVEKPSLLGAEGDVVIYMPKDTPWLKQDEVFVVSQVELDQLFGGNSYQYDSTARLIRNLSNPSLDYGADVRVTIHARAVQPLLDLTLFFLGLPLVLGQYRRNLFVAVGLAMALVAGFSLTVMGAHYLGRALYLSPALAAWLPLFVFVPVAAVLGRAFRR